jgi:hypothetical protein
MFTVPEPAKQRFRPIKFTKDVNDILGKDTLLPLHFPSKQDICDLVHKGECFISLDFSSYYDQFEYAPEIGARFCFRHGTKYFRLNTLAMGQRQAVEVAACTTARLLDFGPKSSTASIIDNVIFVGSRHEVVNDARRFIERVQRVGGQLNEETSDLEALVRSSGDWGGIHLDCASKCSRLMEKTVEKIDRSWRARDVWSWRNFAAHIGLLFWTWQIIELPLSEFFPLLRFISQVGTWVTLDPCLWDRQACVWDSVWPVIERWTLLALRNVPRSVPPSQPPEWIVATDASSWGWGYFAVHNVSGAVRTHGQRWSWRFRQLYGARLQHSVFTEPQAVANALCHLLLPSEKVRARILSDNVAALAAFRRGFCSRSFHLNECVKRVAQVFGDRLHFDVAYIPGELNPADVFSRGKGAQSETLGGSRMSASDLTRLAGGCHSPREL